MTNILIKLKVQNGEYQHEHHCLSNTPETKPKRIEKHVKKYAKDFYGGFSYSDGDVHYFNGGEIAVKLESYTILSEIEYKVLNCLL